MTTPLNLFNSLTRQLEPFQPVHPHEARVYSCGPTVYNYPHIGNMRAYVFADLLGRTLSWKGYRLTHVINITDVGHLTDDADAGEDKLEKAARPARSRSGTSRSTIPRPTGPMWRSISASRHSGRLPPKFVPQMIEFAKSIAESTATSWTAASTSTRRPWPIMAAWRDHAPMREKAGSRPWKASATRPISPSGARPRRARRGRWNGIRHGAGARPAGIWNAR
jgi:hypothetical protein